MPSRGGAALSGVRVVSIAVNLPGPAAAARLTALGATVTTVLPPGGDPMFHFARSYYDELHVGQEFVTADLKDPAGQARLHDLLAEADLLLTSHRPSALARLGLSFGELHERHPRLIQLAIVGHPGAEAEVPGHDLTYQAVTGTVRPPGLPTTLMADLAGAERAVGDGLAALLGRGADGPGCYVEVALSDVAESMAGPVRHGLTVPGGLLGGAVPGYAVYAASDGYVALAAVEPHFFQRVLDALKIQGSATELSEAFAAESVAHWESWAAERDIPLAAVR